MDFVVVDFTVIILKQIHKMIVVVNLMRSRDTEFQ